MAAVQPSELVGGDAAHNAEVVRTVLAGAAGPVRDIVTLNAAAAALAYAGPVLDAPVAAQLAPMLEAARGAIDSGAAAATLERWIRVSRAARED